MIVTAQMLAADPVEQKDCWGTPDKIFRKLNERYGFTLDPCCTHETAKCKEHFTPEEDGLSQTWTGSVFVNPPYSRGNIAKWVQKCAEESQWCTVVALLPVSTSSDWFWRYIIGNTIYWVNKRIRFVNAPFTAPFSSMIVEFNGVCDNIKWNQP